MKTLFISGVELWWNCDFRHIIIIIIIIIIILDKTKKKKLLWSSDVSNFAAADDDCRLYLVKPHFIIISCLRSV